MTHVPIEGRATENARAYREEHLHSAAVMLEVVLESLDLDEERELADLLIEAIQATERAVELDGNGQVREERSTDSDPVSVSSLPGNVSTAAPDGGSRIKEY